MLSAVIIVGGRGKRLDPVTCNVPKPLVRILDKPFLYYLVKQLFNSGVRKVIILAGYLGSQFEDFIQKYSHKFKGLEFIIKISDPDFDTGKRLIDSMEILDDRFIFLYGDNYVPFQLKEYIEKYERDFDNSFVLLYKNDDNYSTSNISIGRDNLILNYGKEKNELTNFVEIGYFIINKEILHDVIDRKSTNFGRDIFSKLIQKGKIYGEVIAQRYYTVGTMERLNLTRLFFSNRKFIFIDRDGVLNEKAPKGSYIKDLDSFKWKKGALSGLKLLKKNNYQIVLITNQAGIGRGVFTINQLEKIHQKMCQDARNYGADIEYIYYCPHHWEDNCNCRKPKPGMLLKAQKDLHIDLMNTYFIGDDLRDGEAAKSAGCKFVLIEKNERLDEKIKSILNLQ